MGRYWFAPVYDSKDHQQIVSQTIIDYFNKLGEKLIKARESGTKLKMSEADPFTARNMRQIGVASPLLNSRFNAGTEYRICETLFSIIDGTVCNYHWYFDNMYKTLCDEIEGGWTYISFEDAIQKQITMIEIDKG